MEARIAKIEREMALISQATQNIAKTLDRMSEMYSDGKVLETKVEAMDKEMTSHFKTINDRINIESESRRWLTKMALLGMSGFIAELFFSHFG